MGAKFYRAMATRQNDAISIMFEFTDNGSGRTTGLYTSEKYATKADVLHTFEGDCSGGFDVIERAIAKIPDNRDDTDQRGRIPRL